MRQRVAHWPLVHHSNQSTYMKTLLRSLPVAFMALLLTLFMTSCAAVGDIFQAGAYTGIIGVIVVIAVIIWIASKFFGGNRNV
ncbi:MAG: hypothetical protein JWP57_3622 [Spirosoma sp.]|nr:hypothetical protein [Spirosoma sp.]